MGKFEMYKGRSYHLRVVVEAWMREAIGNFYGRRTIYRRLGGGNDDVNRSIVVSSEEVLPSHRRFGRSSHAY